MFFYVFVLRLFKFLVLGLSQAGWGCGRLWGWAVVLLAVSCGSVGASAQGAVLQRVDDQRAAVSGTTPFNARNAMHQKEAWLSVAAHLPDPATATPEALETAADVLRARRYPEDALEYYAAAVLRGGNSARLLNKMGVTELGLRHIDRARGYLKLALKRDKKDADAWNNLGATEYMDGRMASAISNYKKALKLRPQAAMFHGNLATALVERKDFDGARKELAKALELDPEFGAKRDGEGGISAHILSPEDHARYCFEMARVYAGKGLMEPMLHSLAMASENGMDLKAKMLEDAQLKAYVTDPRVVVLMQNAKAMAKPTIAAVSGPMTPLPASSGVK